MHRHRNSHSQWPCPLGEGRAGSSYRDGRETVSSSGFGDPLLRGIPHHCFLSIHRPSFPFPSEGENTGLSGPVAAPGSGLRSSHSQICQSNTAPKRCVRAQLSSKRAHLLWVRMCLSIRLNLSEVPEELGKEEKQEMEHRTLFSAPVSLWEDSRV